MKTRYLLLLPLLVVIFALTQSFSGDGGLKYPTGAPAGHTGSPGDGVNCTACHGGTAGNIAGILTSDVPATGYIAGSTYNFTVTLSGSGRKGFQASPQNAAGTQLGTLIAGGNAQLVGNGKYITHIQGSNSATATWNFQWVAPVAQTGPVTMYIARVMGQPNVGVSSLTVNENFSVGFEDLTKGTFRLYPNPAGKHVFADLNLSKYGRVTAIVYNLNGQQAAVLYDGNLIAGKHSLKIENQLTSGYYLLSINTPDGVLNEKLIIK
ncbi:MAG: choice-of-anchor V domain-containing protein [Bacteroidota bacterium]